MLEIFNDSEDSDASLDDNKINSIIRIDFLDDNLLSSQRSIQEYNSNVEVRPAISKLQSKVLQAESLFVGAYKGRQRWDSGKLESKNSREDSNYDSEQMKSKCYTLIFFRSRTCIF